ncbi:MAG: YggS family pyridoxal phosphate-dependent enzyme, partial [Anaerolineales bacterium]|nr:YggS family pyridoxal phosphate-dependent enzyme [Anaerolineales bacterium]
IGEAAARANRTAQDVAILPVTKGHPLEAVRAAYECGFRRVGENRVGEGISKREELSELEDLQWDMVGHIQSRKSKDVAPNFDRVHSIDRNKIARHLNKDAQEIGRTIPVLLECNVSGEESKYGWPLAERKEWDEHVPQFRDILEMEHLKVEGLMTMAPWVEDESVVRNTFRKLRELRDFLREELPAGNWRELSMGMTDDFELAVEEGATILRLGRALFGERPA